MKGAIALRKPVGTVCLDMSSTNVTTSAWATVLAALVQACSAVECINQSGSPLLIALGAGGSEVAIPYTVPPGGSAVLIPVEMKNGARLSAKAVGTSVSAGYLIFNFLG